MAAAPRAARPAISRAAWLVLATTYTAYCCIYCARKPFALVKSEIERHLAVSKQELANIDTALLTTYAIAQLSLGYIVKCVGGRRTVLVLAFLLSGLSTLAFGFVDSPLAMAALWGMAGAFAAPASPLFAIVVGESVPDHVRGTVQGIWSSCENLGGVFANNVPPALASVFGPARTSDSAWRWVFYASGPLVAMWAPLLMLVIPPERTSAPASKPSGAVASPTDDGQGRRTSLLSIPGVAACSACYTLTKCSRYCLMFWLPYFLKTEVSMDGQQAAMVASLLDLSGVAGALLMGIACDRIQISMAVALLLGLYNGSALKAAMHSCAVTGFCFCIWAAACAFGFASTVVHVAAILMIGFFVAGPGGVLGASARSLVGYAGHSSDGELIASVAGLVNGSGSVGAVLQGLLTMQVYKLTGWPGLFGFLGFAMIGSAVALLPAITIEADGLRKKTI